MGSNNDNTRDGNCGWYGRTFDSLDQNYRDDFDLDDECARSECDTHKSRFDSVQDNTGKSKLWLRKHEVGPLLNWTVKWNLPYWIVKWNLLDLSQDDSKILETLYWPFKNMFRREATPLWLISNLVIWICKMTQVWTILWKSYAERLRNINFHCKDNTEDEPVKGTVIVNVIDGEVQKVLLKHIKVGITGDEALYIKWQVEMHRLQWGSFWHWQNVWQCNDVEETLKQGQC